MLLLLAGCVGPPGPRAKRPQVPVLLDTSQQDATMETGAAIPPYGPPPCDESIRNKAVQSSHFPSIWDIKQDDHDLVVYGDLGDHVRSLGRLDTKFYWHHRGEIRWIEVPINHPVKVETRVLPVEPKTGKQLDFVVRDVNYDGAFDVWIGRRKKNSYTVLGPLDDTSLPLQHWPGPAFKAVVGDVNNDGMLDYVTKKGVIGDGVSTLLRLHFRVEPHLVKGGFDFDADGAPDLAVAVDDIVYIFHGPLPESLRKSDAGLTIHLENLLWFDMVEVTGGGGVELLAQVRVQGRETDMLGFQGHPGGGALTEKDARFRLQDVTTILPHDFPVDVNGDGIPELGGSLKIYASPFCEDHQSTDAVPYISKLGDINGDGLVDWLVARDTQCEVPTTQAGSCGAFALVWDDIKGNGIAIR